MLTFGDRNVTVDAGGMSFMNQHLRSVEREKKKKKSSISVHFMRELEPPFE